MTDTSRYIRARVVDFSGPDFAGEVAGPKAKLSAKQRKIRAKLRRARALKRRIASLRTQRPLLWKAAIKKATLNLRLVLVDLRTLGWKPKAPTRARKPGEDELDLTSRRAPSDRFAMIGSALAPALTASRFKLDTEFARSGAGSATPAAVVGGSPSGTPSRGATASGAPTPSASPSPSASPLPSPSPSAQTGQPPPSAVVK